MEDGALRVACGSPAHAAGRTRLPVRLGFLLKQHVVHKSTLPQKFFPSWNVLFYYNFQFGR